MKKRFVAIIALAMTGMMITGFSFRADIMKEKAETVRNVKEVTVSYQEDEPMCSSDGNDSLITFLLDKVTGGNVA